MFHIINYFDHIFLPYPVIFYKFITVKSIRLNNEIFKL